MKIKTDFVTNSSSASYLLLLDVDTYEEFYTYIQELQEKDNGNGETYLSYTLETEKELREYVDNEPLDWVNEARGPRFLWMNESDYNQCLDAINEGKIAVGVDIDYNDSEEFETSDWVEYVTN